MPSPEPDPNLLSGNSGEWGPRGLHKSSAPYLGFFGLTPSIYIRELTPKVPAVAIAGMLCL